jgi:STE24 endopeptidase
VNEDKASRYHRLKRRAAVMSVASSALLLAGLLFTDGSAALREAARLDPRGDPASVSTVAVYVVLLMCVQEAVALPLAWYRSFFLEHRYELSREPIGAWIRDHAKASALGLGLGILGAEVVYGTMRVWPVGWWLASAAVVVVFTLLLTRLAPVWLLPLFYRFAPLERESLRARLLALATRAGVPVLGVYEWGLGAKTRRANAALVGTGGTRRILVSDTLLAEYSDDEIEVILAHELAHHVHRDIGKGLVLEAGLVLGAFYAAAAALDAAWRPLGLESSADVAGLPLLMLAGGAVTLAATPLVNALSRLNERRADRYALRLTRQPAAFMSAMRRLALQNLAEERPSRAVLWLFHTHPPIEERIDAARAFE